MLYIFSALYCELAPFVNAFTLESIGNGVYRSDRCIATVTGVGKVNAAYSVGRTFALFAPSSKDIVLNIGVAAGENKGQTYLVNAISDADTGHDYYPDMVINLGLPESSLTSVTKIVTSVDINMLYDMEASSIYQAAIKHVSPDRMLFVKTVSDSDGKGVTPDKVSSLMESQIRVVSLLLNETQDVDTENNASKYYDVLHCSEYMRLELGQLYHFADTLGVNPDDILDDIIASYIDVNNRKIGREVLDEFKRRLTKV